MADLEADPVGTPESSAPETPSTPAAPVAPAEPSTPLEDLYDFDAPGNDAPPVAETPPSTPATPENSPDPPDPTAPPEPAPVSGELRQRAMNMGISPEYMATFKDPVQLELAVATAERVQMNTVATIANQLRQQQTQQQAPAPQPQPPPEAPAPFNEAAMRAAHEKQGYDSSLSDVLVDQAKQTHGAMVQSHQVALANHQLLQRLQQNESGQQQYQQQLQEIRDQHARENLDRDWKDFNAGLAPEMQKLVGTPEAKSQIQIMANSLLIGMHQSGQKLPSNADAFKTAMYAALGEKLQQAAEGKVREEVKTHQARGTQRPASASQKQTPGGTAESAGRFAEEFMRGVGMPSSNGLEV